MRILITFLLLLSFNSNSQKQVDINNSIVAAEKKLTKIKRYQSDSVYIDSLISIGKQFMISDNTFASNKIKLALQLTDSLFGKDNSRYLNALHQKAIFFSFNKNYEESYKCNKYVLEKRQLLLSSDDINILKSKNNIAQDLFYLNNTEQYFNIMEEVIYSLKISKTYDPEFTRSAFYNLSNYFLNNSKIDLSIYLLEELYSIEINQLDFERAAFTKQSIISYYLQLEQYKKAYFECVESADFCKKYNIRNNELRKYQLEALIQSMYNLAMFNELKKPLEEYNLLTNKSWNEQVWVKYYSIMNYGSSGEMKLLNKELISLEKLYKEKYPLDLDKIGELYYEFANAFGRNLEDTVALYFSQKVYNLYKNLSPTDIRCFNASLALGTSLQNLSLLEEAIQIFENLKLNTNDSIKKNENYFLMMANLSRCYKTLNNTEKSVQNRNDALEAYKNINFQYLKNHVEEFDKLITEQSTELILLNKINELETFYQNIIDFYSVRNDTISQIKNLIKVSRLFSEKLYISHKAKFYLDKCDSLISKSDTVNVQFGKLNHAKGNFYRLKDPNNFEYAVYYKIALDVFKKLDFIGSGELENSACYLAIYYTQLNNIEEAKQILGDIYAQLCKFFGEDSIESIMFKLTELDVLFDYLPMMTLIDEIKEIENKSSNYKENVLLRIKLNSVKIKLFAIGSIERKKIIVDDINLISTSNNFDLKSTLLKPIQLADWYFINDSIEKGKALWNEVLNKVTASKSDELVNTFHFFYASQLIRNKIDLELGIKILEENLKVDQNKLYEQYDDLIYAKQCLGNFDQALLLIEEKENFLIQTYGINSSEFLNFSNNRLSIYNKKGDYFNLIKQSTSLLSIIESKHPNTLEKQIQFIGYLGLGYSKLNNFDQVIDLTTQKTKCFNCDLDNSKLKEMSRSVQLNCLRLNDLNALASLLKIAYSNGLENTKEAIDLVLKMNKIKNYYNYLNESDPENSVNVIYILLKSQLEDSLSETDKFEFLESIDIISKSKNDYTDEFISSILVFSNIIDSLVNEYNIQLPSEYFERIGRFKIADNLKLDVMKGEISRMNQNMFALNENQQLILKSITGKNLNNILLSMIEKIHFSDTSNEMRLLTHSKNNSRQTDITEKEIYELLLNSTGSIFQNWQQLNNEINLNSNLKELKNVWVNLKIESNMTSITERNKFKIQDSLGKIEQKLFQELGKEEYKWLTISELQNKLSSNEILVHTTRVYGLSNEYNFDDDSIIYLHFVIRGDSDKVKVYALKMDKEKESECLDNYLYHINGKGKEKPDMKSYFYLFPFMKNVEEGKKIIFIPDGIYFKINPSSILNPVNGHFLNELYETESINYPSKLLKSKIYSDTSKNAALFGDPSFLDKKTIKLNSETELQNSFPIEIRESSKSLGNFSLAPLSNTKKEVLQINEVLKSNNWVTEVYISENANENNLSSIKNSRILHIATHGYFLEDIANLSPNGTYMGVNIERILEDPMLRSGLLLSGASNTLRGELYGEYDGVFSAYEASLLDLSNTELVVLSACETGKGEIKNSEGVYGLRKGFADAGAKNVIMSLWKVDDKVTQEFMTRFYEIWLNDKTTIREAFNKTQLEIMSKYPEPYYWGAFILVEN